MMAMTHKHIHSVQFLSISKSFSFRRKKFTQNISNLLHLCLYLENGRLQMSYKYTYVQACIGVCVEGNCSYAIFSFGCCWLCINLFVDFQCTMFCYYVVNHFQKCMFEQEKPFSIHFFTLTFLLSTFDRNISNLYSSRKCSHVSDSVVWFNFTLFFILSFFLVLFDFSNLMRMQ